MIEPAALPAPETTILVCTGEYDIACRSQFRADLEPLAHTPKAILDFTGVTYVDSTIVGELVRLHKIRGEAGYDGEAIALRTPNIRKLFNLLRLDTVFRLVDALEDALDGGPVTMLYSVANASRSDASGTPIV